MPRRLESSSACNGQTDFWASGRPDEVQGAERRGTENDEVHGVASQSLLPQW